MRSSPKISGTYLRIWHAVRRIPKGRVATYGTIARLAGYDGQARLVGYALHALPAGTNVPWHRVINSRGRISLPTLSTSHKRQRLLLGNEGIVFDAETVDLIRFGWPSAPRGASRR